MKPDKPTNFEEYVMFFPEHIQLQLNLLRETIKAAVPMATEVISYGMPAFKLKRILVYFAAYKNHIGLYPTASGVEAFKAKLTNYKSSKGAIQFPINQPLPLDLITQIVKFRLNEVLKSD